jgi:hypothetical protein
MYPILLSLYVNETPTPSRHVELVLYTDVTSRQRGLLVNFLETSQRPRVVTEKWRITFVSESTMMFFAKTGRRIPKPRPIQFFGQPIRWVDTAR